MIFSSLSHLTLLGVRANPSLRTHYIMSETLSQKPFQAEVKQLLDIVINSLYTDREIFIRELVSNASDASEKMRLKSLTEDEVNDADAELKITLSCDEEAGTLTFSDHGIGMTEEELTENLGTIAHSGTKSFLNQLKEKGDNNADVIGQFGVGFYSVFMVADKVEVFTRSWEPNAPSLKWTSDGTTGYTVERLATAEPRGSRIVAHLKEEFVDFAKEATVTPILKRYSSFVSFPVILGEERVNTLEAIWLKSKSEVTEEEYKEFYQFTAHAFDEPRYTMHFSADAPLAINALLFTPKENTEQFGFGQMEPGVALYCRKVLIDPKPDKLLPEWLRFLKGVIDSADLPLNISRESMQDSALIQKLNSLITKRFLKFLERKAKNDHEAYLEFFAQFGRFLKEGIASSYEHRELLASLIRFDSTLEEEKTSFDAYIDRAKDDQDTIYYLVGRSREQLENGPYLEAFKSRGLEVALFTDPVDEYVLDTMNEYKGKKLVAANSADIDLDDVEQEGEPLDEKSAEALVGFLNGQLEGRVKGVEVSKRLVGSPIAALQAADAPSPQIKAMMKQMGQEMPDSLASLEINSRHPLIKQLSELSAKDEATAGLVAQQLADHALMAAGLLEQPEQMATRFYDLLEKVVSK